MSPNGVYCSTRPELCAGLDAPEVRSGVAAKWDAPSRSGHEIYKPGQINYRKFWEREIGTGEAIFPLVRPARQCRPRWIAVIRGSSIGDNFDR
jgi:hypothetical protein